MRPQPPRRKQGTVEVDPHQIVEERSHRPPPPLPGSTVEVQSVQILDERMTPAGSRSLGTVRALLVDDPEAPPSSPVYRLTSEEVDWSRLDALDSDLLIRFTFGAPVDAIVSACGVEPERAREAIDRLVRAGLLVS
jgi:hypothetical protein